MTAFNAKKYYDSTVFTCINCGSGTSFKIANSGCPSCSYHLFKVSNRSGTPQFWDRDQADPYLRQKQSPFGGQSGAGNKLTNPNDEGWFGGGFGGRARKGFPEGVSEGGNEYEEQRKTEIPGSYDDMISESPSAERSYDISSIFTDPTDSLSQEQNVNRKMDQGDEELTMDKRLQLSRNNNSISTRLDDSVFERVRKRQRGISR